jgi:hypothetical protein
MRLTDHLRPLLLRTLSLFGPGELRVVRVIDPKCFDVIVSELDRPDSLGAVRLAQALSSLRAVAWSTYGMRLEPAFGFIERYGADLTELDCSFFSGGNKAADSALTCCARLEFLANAQAYDAKVWLGLTHLHTLRGVDFSVVSVAAIAAALPRLHTLAAFINVSSVSPFPHTVVAGFFEDLVPRLQVFDYHGSWPVEDDQAPVAILPQPLPLLQELVFWCPTDFPVARGFMGARPVKLVMPYAAVDGMLRAVPLMTSEATYRPLARVRHLWLARDNAGGAYPDTSDVARLLRAAPQLRKFMGCLPGGFDWLDDPAFRGLVHPWLRSVCVSSGAEPAPFDCGVQLRRLHFPRLQQLIVNSVQHLVHDE